jgi:hypothetical protein
MEQRYSAKEALNRILRLLKGVPPATDVPGEVTGEILSEDHAFSEIAELLARSLPGEYTSLPWSEYGGVYGVSGSSIGLQDKTWRRVPLTNNGLSSSRVSPDQANNQITINDQGTYFVEYQVSYLMDVNRELSFGLISDDEGYVDQFRAMQSGVTGTYKSVSVGAFLSVIAGERMGIEMYSGNGTGTATILHSQLNVRKVY